MAEEDLRYLPTLPWFSQSTLSLVSNNSHLIPLQRCFCYRRCEPTQADSPIARPLCREPRVHRIGGCRRLLCSHFPVSRIVDCPAPTLWSEAKPFHRRKLRPAPISLFITFLHLYRSLLSQCSATQLKALLRLHGIILKQED